MENENLVVFILTHGRPDNVRTLQTIRKHGYTGLVYYIVDNEDKSTDKYIQNFGEEYVKIFDKKAVSEELDEGHNFDYRKVILYARHACFQIARDIGVKYFIQLDDDYTDFYYRYTKPRIITNLDAVFNIMLDFFKKTNIKSIALSQGGDHIGGFQGIKLKRKCMNSFICSTDREFKFTGALNEDVCTYVTLGSRGDVFFTFTNVQLKQQPTQSQKSGITDIYLKLGTYSKSFTAVMMHPSSVVVGIMHSKHRRIHHEITWGNTVPKIISEKYKKAYYDSSRK